MFGLATFASTPFSSFLQFTDTTAPIAGLQANALLNSVSGDTSLSVAVAGVEGITSLNIGTGTGGITYPNRWTSVETDQYRSA